MGMLNDTQFAIQETRNQQSKQFVGQESCMEMRETMDVWTKVSFPTFLPVM